MSRKKANGGGGRKRAVRPYASTGRRYQELMEQVGLNQRETATMFGFAHRTSRRYKRGEGKVPQSALILLRLMADGVLSKRQVLRAVH